MANPKVFISYSHDTPAHKAWVLKLATSLRGQGVDAVLDQWDLKPGQDIAGFMQHGIADAERVVMVCSENYVAKAEAGVGGVGYERLIVTAEVSANIDTKKFVPVRRMSGAGRKVPDFLGSRLYVDFEDDGNYDLALEELARELHGIYKLEKPVLGTPKFSAAPAAAVATAVQAVAERSLDDKWFTARAEHATAGLEKLGFSGSMEVRSSPGQPFSASQRELLAAIEASKIRTFGWPIAVTLSTDEWSAKPYADGVRAEVSIPLEKSKTGNASYDYWAVSADGKFYTQINLFEDDRGENLIYFNSRIVRVAESLMFLTGMYERLGVAPDIPIKARFMHRGLAGRTLQSAGPSRSIRPRSAVEDRSSVEVEFILNDVSSSLPKLVQEVCAPMFTLFEFTEFGDNIYADIVTRFQNGEAS